MASGYVPNQAHMDRIVAEHGRCRVALDRAALADGFLFLVNEVTGALITEVRDLTLVQELESFSVVEATFIAHLSEPGGC